MDHDQQTAIRCDHWLRDLQLVNLVSGKVEFLSDEIIALMPFPITSTRRSCISAGLWRNRFLCHSSSGECVLIDLDNASVMWSASFPSPIETCIYGDRVAVFSLKSEGLIQLFNTVTNDCFPIHGDGSEYRPIDVRLDSCKLIALLRKRIADGDPACIAIHSVIDGSLLHKLHLENSGQMVLSPVVDRIIFQSWKEIAILDFSNRWHNHAPFLDCIILDMNGTPMVVTWPAPSLLTKLQEFFLPSQYPVCSCIYDGEITNGWRTRIHCWEGKFFSRHMWELQPNWVTTDSFPSAMVPASPVRVTERSVYLKQVLKGDQCYFTNMSMNDWELCHP
eukprot:TRINITY_DN6978_c0_g1_i1.p1 TRINITY_DN6978_c0_g1~~TRINITY_DN6978_c0_g1_i1.p1  ORF type:complete len:334 (-),score=18.83 TRINITY_DN6978_c0_g1_i1:51-1052(-)